MTELEMLLSDVMQELFAPYGTNKLEVNKRIFSFLSKYPSLKPIEICKYAGVSKSSYYEWLKTKKMSKEKLDPILVEMVKSTFEKHKGRYGRERIQSEIKNEYGVIINHKLVSKILSHLNLKASAWNTKKIQERKNTMYSEEDRIKQNFKAEEPHKKWFTDVTFIKVAGKVISLSAVIDGFNNEIIDYKIHIGFGRDFVLANIKDALKKAKNPNEIILHSDHGVEYTSQAYNDLKIHYGFRSSMGRKGKSLDNRPIEFFWRQLKTESLNQILGAGRTIERIVEEIDGYIYYYNNERIQMKLDGLSPIQYRLSKTTMKK